MRRVFLDWKSPILETAADWLAERYFVGGRVNMQNVLIAVPGSRAKRRLEELLQQKASLRDPAWFPPHRITTLGTFPELLYPQKRPAASSLVQQFAWSRAFERLDKTDADKLKYLIPQLPEKQDWPGKIALGRLVAQLHLELAADRVDFDQMAVFCRRKKMESEAQRWETLADLQKLYIGELDKLELWDIQTARAYALEHNEYQTSFDVVLIGLVDMNRTQRAILDAVGDQVTVLVFAPESLADHFDEYGCVDSEKWHDRPIDISDDSIEPADTPSHQATAVLRWLKRLDARYSAGEIVIGTPDANVVPFLLQQLGQAGLDHRSAAGTAVAQTPLFLLLETLGSYLQNRRFHDLATLVRHPDLERLLFDRLNDNAALKTTVAGRQSWITEFDAYYKEHLPLAVDGHWLPKHRREEDDDSELDVSQNPVVRSQTDYSGTAPRQILSLTESLSAPNLISASQTSDSSSREYRGIHAVYQAVTQWIDTLFKEPFESERSTVQQLLFDPDEAHDSEIPNAEIPNNEINDAGALLEAKYSVRKLPHDWVEAMDRFLQNIYKNRDCDAGHPPDHLLLKSFEQLHRLYREILDVPRSLAPAMTVAETLTLLLQLWRPARIPPLRGENGIELLGWLELFVDDAPALAVTGLNEGIVPSSKTSDMFLPDSIRRELQLEDNRRRFARDAYALSAILASRKNVRLIFGKRNVEGDLLLPSRLFFAVGEETVAKRVKRFSASPKSDATASFFSRTLQAGQKKSLFSVPEPIPLGLPLKHIRVTEFRDYLQCPYRYFLKHKMQLTLVDDVGEELDGGAFGDIAHRVLKLFGKSKFKDSKDADEIRDYLSRQLNVVVRDLYGDSFRPVIAVQVEQIRYRLSAFADAQAKWAADGHEIMHVEYAPSQYGGIPIDVDGIPVMIRGRIDRVDFNHKTGKYVLLDYKTGGAGDDPEFVHRKNGEWVDLQLPLYRTLFCESHDHVSDDVFDVELGYVSLPKDASKTKFLLAKWQEPDLLEADGVMKSVIRNIRRELFWPPADPPPAFSELFSSICLDRQLRFSDETSPEFNDSVNF